MQIANSPYPFRKKIVKVSHIPLPYTNSFVRDFKLKNMSYKVQLTEMHLKCGLWTMRYHKGIYY